MNEIIKETQREAIINRPHNLAGSVKGVTKARFSVSEQNIKYGDSTITPALLKLFMEALDNPIDVAIISGLPIKIDIKVTDRYISVKDTGTGVPSTKKNGVWQAFSAFCEYNTSSNYKENRGQGQKGTNGIGVKLCTTLSSKMIIDSSDGKKCIHIVATDNNLHHQISETPTSDSGVKIKFYPDFDIFDVDEINKEHIQRMYEYTLIQALTYPNITFRFNNRTVRITPKKFMSFFPDAVLDEQKDYFVAVAPNPQDDFKHISYVNGLETHLGGSHVEWVTKNIVQEIRNKLQKKKETAGIKPGDIKNKLLVVVIARNMKNVDWDGQTKASITSPDSMMRQYFKTDWQKMGAKILRSQEIMLPITELFALRARAKENAEIKKLKRSKKRIKSEKYLQATKNKKILFLCEGASAVGGLVPALGREDYGFFELRGVPLNAYDASQARFTQNKELSELFQVIQNEDYEYICTATDADADGSHIKGLLLGFFKRYLPDILESNKFGELRTPVQAVLKNKKLQRWTYDLGTNMEIGHGEIGKYFKGLGSWDTKKLKEVINKDGIENMIRLFELDSLDILDDWLAGDKAVKRKEYISNNTFDITGI